MQGKLERKKETRKQETHGKREEEEMVDWLSTDALTTWQPASSKLTEESLTPDAEDYEF